MNDVIFVIKITGSKAIYGEINQPKYIEYHFFQVLANHHEKAIVGTHFHQPWSKKNKMCDSDLKNNLDTINTSIE